MTCADRRDLLLLYAAGALEPAEREALRAHLSTGCPVCAGALAESEAIVAQAAGAIAPVAPPPAALDKLMARVAGTPERSPAPMRIAGARNRTVVTAAIAAAAAVAVTAGAFLYATRDARRTWRNQDIATVTLASETQPTARGAVWWDRDRGQWRVTVAQLAPPAPGREYELWFIPKGGKPIRSKSFGVDKGGEAEFLVNVPPGLGDDAVAAITDEPIGGVDAPTGKIHLAGNFE